MKVTVLGAGLLGTTSAWYLAQAGHEVTVLDRQPAPGLETSFANGGQISVSHAEPWANPTAPLRVLQWLGREDAPLLFRLRADPAQWLWGLRFLRECLPGRTRANTEAAFALAMYSRDCLRALRGETGITYDEATRGILYLFTDEQGMAHARDAVTLLRGRGFDTGFCTPEQCRAIEPALARSRTPLLGGAYTASDESGDAHLFTTRLAALARARGVAFRECVNVLRIEAARGRVERVVAVDRAGIEESVRADAYVLALGSYSAPVARTAGLSLPVYPVKGYSITIALRPDEAALAPTASLTDDARRIVFSRLGDRLRVAGTAELDGYNTDINEVRCEALRQRAAEWFPGLSGIADAQTWAGLRPATPSNQPLVGRSRLPNLYLNTGHGTLGWTMACGSSRALADLVCGRRPEVDFPFLGTDRNRNPGAAPASVP